MKGKNPSAEFSPFANSIVYFFLRVYELANLRVSRKLHKDISTYEDSLVLRDLKEIYAADGSDSDSNPILAPIFPPPDSKISAKAIYLVQVRFFNLYDEQAKNSITEEGGWASSKERLQFSHIKNMIKLDWLILAIAGQRLKFSDALKLPVHVGDIVKTGKCTPEEAFKLTQLQADALQLGLSKNVALDPAFTQADYNIAFGITGMSALSGLTLEDIQKFRVMEKELDESQEHAPPPKLERPPSFSVRFINPPVSSSPASSSLAGTDKSRCCVML